MTAMSPEAFMSLLELRFAMVNAQRLAETRPLVVLHPDTMPSLGSSIWVEIVRNRYVPAGQAYVFPKEQAGLNPDQERDPP